MTGDLKSTPRSEGNTITNGLTFVLAPGPFPVKTVIPELNGAETQGVIDLEVVRDKEKETVKLESHKCPLCEDNKEFDTLDLFGKHLIKDHGTE